MILHTFLYINFNFHSKKIHKNRNDNFILSCERTLAPFQVTFYYRRETRNCQNSKTPYQPCLVLDFLSHLHTHTRRERFNFFSSILISTETCAALHLNLFCSLRKQIMSETLWQSSTRLLMQPSIADRPVLPVQVLILALIISVLNCILWLTATILQVDKKRSFFFFKFLWILICICAITRSFYCRLSKTMDRLIRLCVSLLHGLL